MALFNFLEEDELFVALQLDIAMDLLFLHELIILVKLHTSFCHFDSKN